MKITVWAAHYAVSEIIRIFISSYILPLIMLIKYMITENLDRKDQRKTETILLLEQETILSE